MFDTTVGPIEVDPLDVVADGLIDHYLSADGAPSELRMIEVAECAGVPVGVLLLAIRRRFEQGSH